MQRSFARHIRSVLLATITLAAAPAVAQAAAQATAEITDDPNVIVITARRVSETLNEAPVAITAFTAASLEAQNLRDFNDLATLTPGLSFSQAFGRNTDRPVIRGLSNVLAGVQFGVESGVSVFIDGALFRGDIQSLNFDAMERIEIVKGSQSALYGRNTYAGAINFITKTPGDRVAGQARVRVAQYGEVEATANIELPLVAGLAALRIDGRYFNYEGEFINQITRQQDVGGQNSRSVAGTLYVTPAPSVSWRTRVEYSEDRDEEFPRFLQGGEENNCSPGFRSVAFRGFGPRTSTNTNQYFCGTIQPRPDNVFINTNVPGVFNGGPLLDGRTPAVAISGTYIKRWFVTSKLNVEVGAGWAFTAIGAWRKDRTLTGFDSDHSNFNFFNGNPATTESFLSNTNARRLEDYSGEVQFASPQDRPIRALVGGYFYNFVRQQNDVIKDGAGGFTVTPFLTTLTANNERETINNRSVFGRVEVDPVPTLTIGFEGRYLYEKKGFGNVQGGALVQARPFETRDFIPRITIDWKPDNSTLIYAIYTEGNKPGGVNGAIGALNGIPEYLDETLKGGEIGLKKGLLDNTLQINFAGYYNRVNQVQLTQPVPTNPAVTTGNTTSIASNQGDARVWGLELELVARPSREVTVTVGYAWTDAKFTRGCDEFQYALNSGGRRQPLGLQNTPSDPRYALCDIAGKRLPLGSEHQGSVALDYRRDINQHIQFFSNVTVSLESNKFVQVHNLAGTGATTLVGTRLGIGNDTWTLSVFGRNLFNEDSIPLATRWLDFSYGFAPRGIAPADLPTADTGAPRAFFAALRRSRSVGVEGRVRF
jgi:outer membrane receptor protein involved in Fe transport